VSLLAPSLSAAEVDLSIVDVDGFPVWSPLRMFGMVGLFDSESLGIEEGCIQMKCDGEYARGVRGGLLYTGRCEWCASQASQSVC
jgi:hypothetical protein